MTNSLETRRIILSLPAQAGEARTCLSPSVTGGENLSLSLPPSPPVPALSSRARLRRQALRGICSCLLLFASLAFASLCLAAHRRPLPLPSKAAERPRIFGIAYVQIQVSNLEKARGFYSIALHAAVPPADSKAPCNWCEVDVPSMMKQLADGPVRLDKMKTPPPSSLLTNIAFWTPDIQKLHSYLRSHDVGVGKIGKCEDAPCFSVLDPEHHLITFIATPQIVEPTIKEIQSNQQINPYPRCAPIIHAGFIVHDRAAEDHFYKDILGFHVYWHGGMVDRSAVAREKDTDDWVDMQVPDGTDWIEYMLNVPANADHRTLGVMNHFALGVPDIHAAEQQLLKNGMKLTEQPQIGRDGKWQLNLYDPDGTRVEFMEFTPVQKPCCAPITGPNPGPNSGPK